MYETFVQFLDDTYPTLVFIFTASNMALMGLQVKSAEVITMLKNGKAMLLIVLWGWVLGPIVGLLVAWLLQLQAPFVIGLLLYSLAPCAPFVPLFVSKAQGDISFAGALVPLVVIFTVILTPPMAPVLITGVEVSAVEIATLLLTTVLVPLAIGAAIKEFAEQVATKIFPLINIIAKLTTLATIVGAVLIYWPQMLDTAGSRGLLSMTLFMVVMGAITYRGFGSGLKQNQRSVMSLGMLSRNGAVVLLTAFSIDDVDPLVITYVVMYVLASFVVAAIAARIFGKISGKNEVVG